MKLDEQNVLEALAEKPLVLPVLRRRLVTAESEEVIHLLLMRMRDEGKVKFDIHSGKWSAPR